jgi:hypothetical protein
MAKAMTKTQVVAHLAEKVELPKRTAAALLEALVALATKEAKATGQVRGPRAGEGREARPQGAPGPQSADGRGHHDPGEDRGPLPLGQSVQGRHHPAEEEVALRPRPARPSDDAPASGLPRLVH